MQTLISMGVYLVGGNCRACLIDAVIAWCLEMRVMVVFVEKMFVMSGEEMLLVFPFWCFGSVYVYCAKIAKKTWILSE